MALLWGCAAMIAAQLLVTHAPFMNRLFHTAPISAAAWLHILAVAGVAYAVVGFEKWVRAQVVQKPARAPQTRG